MKKEDNALAINIQKVEEVKYGSKGIDNKAEN